MHRIDWKGMSRSFLFGAGDGLESLWNHNGERQRQRSSLQSPLFQRAQGVIIVKPTKTPSAQLNGKELQRFDTKGAYGRRHTHSAQDGEAIRMK